jgi:thiol-disulfide isomerase/thioredoxin
MRLRWILATLAAAALAWTTVMTEFPWFLDAKAVVKPLPGEACPADAKAANLSFTLKDVNDQNVNLSDFKGKVLLLDFWATWCGPCKVEIPWFLEFQSKYGKDGLQVIGVSIDDTLKMLKPYVTSMKMTYPVLQGLGHDNVADAYGPMPAVPVTVLISRDGKICAKHIGIASKEDFENGIKSLLATSRL